MLMTKKKKITIIICASVVTSLALAVAIPFIVLASRSASIKSNYAYLKEDKTYQTSVEVKGIELVNQHISCGYATIEMMSSFYGKRVSEDELSAKNDGRITTSSSSGFYREVSESIPNKSFVRKSYLKNDALLKEIHASLENNNPVAIEWAAKYEGEWTLHFSLISGLDLLTDKVTVYNPYGFIESITVSEFISRSTFEAYQNIPLFLNFGFAYGAFEKNAIFYAK